MTQGDNRLVSAPDALYRRDYESRTRIAPLTAPAVTALSANDDRLAIARSSGNIELISLAGGSVVAKTSVTSPTIALAGHDDGSFAAVQQDGAVVRWDPRSGAVSSLANSGHRVALAAIGGRKAALWDGRGIQLVEFGTRVSKPWKLSESQPIAMALPVDGKATLIALGDGSLIVVNSQSGERLARLVTTASGWAVLDYSGRFDGNTTGIEAVSWQSDIKTLELSDLARKYFEPGMLSNVIAGSLASLAAIPASLGDSVAMPPKVELKVSEEGPRQPGMPFQVAVIVEDLGGGMDDIRLFHNGKLVDKGALVQTQNFAEQKRKFRGLVFNVVPTAGLNTFRATAKSIEGIEAGSQRLSQTFGGNASNGRLHILAVGIDDYLAPIPPLRLAAKDADELRKRIAAGSKSFAGQSQTVLLNEKATRESVLGALASIGRDAAPEDTIVVFLAGHGVSVSDREWLFLPWGADGSSIPALKRTSISSQSLQDVLVGAKAHRIVLAIDACQSGAAFGAFAEQRTAFLRLLSNVSRDTGIVVYAATQDGSDSYEIETLGHGIFTYAMMEGLNQKSRTGSQQVTAFELADYVEQTVPSLAQLYKLGRQDSATFRLGVDFPVATRMK